MNMMFAEKANWANYTPGQFPDNVKSVTVNSPTQLTFTLNSTYSSTWFTGGFSPEPTCGPLMSAAGFLIYWFLRGQQPWLGLAVYAAYLMHPALHQVYLSGFRRETLASNESWPLR